MVAGVWAELSRKGIPVILVFSEDDAMTLSGGNREQAFASAREQYAEWGVDVEIGPGAAFHNRDLAPLLAG